MRIVQFINTLSVSDGGPARNSLELNLALNFLPEIQARLVSIHGVEAESGISDLDSAQVPSNWLSPMFLSLASARRRVRTAMLLIHESDYVVLHGYYLPWLPFAAAACIITRTSFVITPHGALTTHQQNTSRAKKFIFEATAGWWMRRGCKSFITGSRTEADDIRRRFRGSRADVGGVGTAMPSRHDNAGLRSPISLLSLSRIAPKKRIDLSIRATRILVDRGRNIHLTIAGEGDPSLLASLRDLVSELELDSQVTFVGSVRGEEKSHLLADADVFLLPSDDENFGIALAEALAHGIPSVASEAVAASDGLALPSGVVVREPTGASLSDAIERLVSHIPYAEARAAARAFAIERFSWKSAAKRWEHALRVIDLDPPTGRR